MRLIDADALWMDVIRSVDYCDDILEFIERQPTVEQPHWIPCSERLPDESNFYMVTNEYDEVEIIWFSHKDDYDIDKSEWRETDDKIIAWMPLPEPYVREGELE